MPSTAVKSESMRDVWCAIIAGGRGTRLFPISHDLCPKQFCAVDAKHTFIQATAQRFQALGVRSDRILVLTANKTQHALASAQLLPLGVTPANIRQIESRHGYASSMIKAAEFIAKYDPQAIIINSPADQFIVLDDDFYRTLNLAVHTARAGNPTVVGVKVKDLVTVMGCGHAIYDPEEQSAAKKVLGFIEKPSSKTAKKLLCSSNSACNTGINVWAAKTILRATSDPNLDHRNFDTDNLMRCFQTLRLAVGAFQWHDCGTLKSLYDISAKTPRHHNVVLGSGKSYRFACRRSLFYVPNGVTATFSGFEDSAVVINELNGKMVGVALPLEQSQKVRELAEEYATNHRLLSVDASIDARNNHISRTAFSLQSSFGIIGMSNISITPLKYPDGRIVYAITNDASSLVD